MGLVCGCATYLGYIGTTLAVTHDELADTYCVMDAERCMVVQVVIELYQFA